MRVCSRAWGEQRSLPKGIWRRHSRARFLESPRSPPVATLAHSLRDAPSTPARAPRNEDVERHRTVWTGAALRRRAGPLTIWLKLTAKLMCTELVLPAAAEIFLA